MVAIFAVAILSAAALWIVSRQARPQPVLALVPVALLFFTIPTSAAVIQLIAGFRQLADQRLRGGAAIISFCAIFWDAALFGGLGFLITIGLAAALQVRGAFGDDDQLGSDGTTASHWPRWVLIGSSLLVVPVGVYALRAQQIPKTVMRAAQAAEQGQFLTGAQMQQLSATVARECLLAILFGVTLSLALLAAAAGSLSASRRHRPDRSLSGYSWAVLVVCSLIAISMMLRANADSRLFARVLP